MNENAASEDEDMEMTQAVGTVEANPIRLRKEITEEMVKALDMHLSAMVELFHQYYKHHWLAKGPQFRELHLFFEKNYREVQEDFDKVAERITILGGVPSSSMQRQDSQSFISPEDEGDHPIRQMVRKDMEDEGMLAEKLRETIQRSIDLKDFGSEYLLKKILYACENRAHELDHFLANDTLDSSRFRSAASRRPSH